MQDWLTLDRRPTLVFGAGGLGGACALSLAAQGARVALVDVNQDKLDAVVRAAKEADYESWSAGTSSRAWPICSDAQ
jgi:NAD(P)-dependent dehydrogenase (short-subunit alcohol dehydrogenase family)